MFTRRSGRLVKIVENALEGMSAEERTFPLIQNEAIISCTNHQDSSRLADPSLFYELLLGLREKYGIVLYTPELEKDIKLGSMDKRKSEVLGRGLYDLSSFFALAKKGKASAHVIAIDDRGYTYVMAFNENVYVVKPIQGEGEAEVIRVLKGSKYAPRNEDLSDEWLAEEFVPGNDFGRTVIDPSSATITLANVFAGIHSRGVVYGDQFITHLKMSPRGPVLIDFGTSVIGTDFRKDLDRVKNYLNDSTAFGKFKSVYERVMVA